jgi:hypothetical protein
MKEPGRVLEPVEILTEWQKSGWVEYSPDGSELRITPSGVGKLGEWEEENKLWRSGQNKQPPQDGTTTGKEPTALVQSLLGDLSKLPSGDSIKLDALRKRGRLIIAKVFGNASRYLTDLESIKFHAATYQQAVKPEMARGSWDRGREKFKNLCNTMLEDINLPDTPPVKDTKPDLETPIMKRDRELQRLLLLEVRDGQKPPELSKYSEADKVYNAALLINSGLVDGEAVQGGSGEYVSTVMTQLTSAGHDFLEKDTPSTEGSLESAFPTELAESLKKFRKDYPDRRKCAFIMMRFGATKAHTDIVESIRNALSAHGINALRADDKDYHDDLFWNILTYIYSCSFGIAVFERIEQEEFNPNVSLEVGYMMALRKPVLLLKDRTLRNLNTDLMGKLYKTFDPQSISGSVKPQLLRWMKDKNIIA